MNRQLLICTLWKQGLKFSLWKTNKTNIFIIVYRMVKCQIVQIMGNITSRTRT